MKPLRIYTDTSVIGGCLDAEFAEHSLRFIDQVNMGRVVLLVSELLVRELSGAPSMVRSIMEDLPMEQLENVIIDEEVESLRDAYLQAGILARRWQDDATHVAAASVAGADAIVSWNFRHIVRLALMRRYNEVNAKMGYRHLNILTPVEVAYEPDDEEDQDL
ncbi:MAG: type II toxin-antitoxin system VapC family toxin [bacterium]|nr:type II toxin-antitoxin system VapC family toxin [bacterium]